MNDPFENTPEAPWNPEGDGIAPPGKGHEAMGHPAPGDRVTTSKPKPPPTEAEELRTLIHKRQHWIEKWDGTIQGTLAIIAGLLSRDNEKEAERQARMMVHHALMYGRFKADIIRAERRLKELEGEE